MTEAIEIIGLLLVGAAAYTYFVVHLTLWVLDRRLAREDAIIDRLEAGLYHGRGGLEDL